MSGYIILGSIFSPIYLAISAAVAMLSKDKKMSFLMAFVWCILTSPFIGYFIISNSGSRNPIGCKHCGNEENEAEICGLCGKSIYDSVEPESDLL